MHNHFLRWLAIIIISSVLLLVGNVVVSNSPSAYADTDGACGSSAIPSYMGTLNPPKGVYDVYVKLGKTGQNASVAGYVQFDQGVSNCLEIGSVDASGSEWRKLGNFTDVSGGKETVIQLSSIVLENLPDANRPTVMLVPQTNPVCVPTIECETIISGQRAYIRPAGNALENDSLHIVRVDSVDLKYVTKVQYFVDNKMLYETKTLQEFKNEDLPFYAGKLIRVLYYQSGQTAVIETNAPEISNFTVWTPIVRYIKIYQNTLWLIAGLIGVVIIVHAISFIRRYIASRRKWKIDHGFMKDEADLAITPEQIRRLEWRIRFRKGYYYIERIIVIVVIVTGFVSIMNAYYLQIGTVSGESMVSTLHDGQRIYINKTQVTFARLNNRQYVPRRGDIAVAYPNFGTLDTSLKQEDESLIVKRVVGLPGDRVVVTGQHLKVYNKDHLDGFDPDASMPWSAHVQYEASDDSMDITLGENEVFLVGDNRPVSIDSRYNGPIGTNQIVGVVSGQ